MKRKLSIAVIAVCLNAWVSIVKRRIDGTWALDDGSAGGWHAERYSVKQE